MFNPWISAVVVCACVLERSWYAVGSVPDPVHFSTKCTAASDGCTYDITVSASTCSNSVFQGSRQTLIRHDHKDKLAELERNFVDLKNDHSRRLDSLEVKLSAVTLQQRESLPPSSSQNNIEQYSKESQLDSKRKFKNRSGGSYKTASDLFVNTQTLKDEGTERHEKVLLSQLQKEFSSIRKELTNCRRDLRDSDDQISIAKDNLNLTEHYVLLATEKSQQKERQLAEALSSNEILIGSLTSADSELEAVRRELVETQVKLTKSVSESVETRRQLNEAVEELGRLRVKERELEQCQGHYANLSEQHANLSALMKTTERKLLDCQQGKTSRFCGFEDPDICGFTQQSADDSPTWVRWKAKSPSVSTGPSADHTCANNKGYYMYVDARSSVKESTARMLSTRYHGTGEQCLQFFYHMNGRYIGTLNVYILTDVIDTSPMWRAFGNQGDVWIKAQLEVSQLIAEQGYQVVFEGIMAEGYLGDIAIDDVQVLNETCEQARKPMQGKI